MSAPPKYAKRVDGNQAAIVAALEADGFWVVVIGQPVDLLYSRNSVNGLMECKRPGMEHRADQESQRDFIQTWPGQVSVAVDPVDAVRQARAVCHVKDRSGFAMGKQVRFGKERP